MTVINLRRCFFLLFLHSLVFLCVCAKRWRWKGNTFMYNTIFAFYPHLLACLIQFIFKLISQQICVETNEMYSRKLRLLNMLLRTQNALCIHTHTHISLRHCHLDILIAFTTPVLICFRIKTLDSMEFVWSRIEVWSIN